MLAWLLEKLLWEVHRHDRLLHQVLLKVHAAELCSQISLTIILDLLILHQLVLLGSKVMGTTCQCKWIQSSNLQWGSSSPSNRSWKRWQKRWSRWLIASLLLKAIRHCVRKGSEIWTRVTTYQSFLNISARDLSICRMQMPFILSWMKFTGNWASFMKSSEVCTRQRRAWGKKLFLMKSREPTFSFWERPSNSNWLSSAYHSRASRPALASLLNQMLTVLCSFSMPRKRSKV